MALSATIFKARLQVSDLRRHYYAEHTPTVARHPSETDERMMLRLLAFALYADDALQLTRGLSTDEEPELWQHNLQGEIELWIELGQPTEKRLRQARGQARHVVVLSYGGRTAQQWWQSNGPAISKLEAVSVYELAPADTQALAAMAARNMDLQVTLDEDTVWVSTHDHNIALSLTTLCEATL